MSKYNIFKTHEFLKWYDSHSSKHQLQIDERIRKISDEGYFGDHKELIEGLWELKWKIGWRVYYTYIAKYDLLFILGGNKNGQSKDIKKAEKLVYEYLES